MKTPAIRVENLTKIFRIYDRPVDRLKEVFSFNKSFHRDFTALDQVSFEVNRGEFLGIVGRNGAGKSTLLKILSGELVPSVGDVQINGSVSLLQLGVGFNPELSGAENAHFAAKLLGFSDEAFEKIFPKIAEFADIGDFIYHPVKTYSSGMYSRLSFAVAININPDILIADEVLAVGDIRFSQKCLRKMREFKESGKTVILVTHDSATVSVFCDRAIWLDDGKIYREGTGANIAEEYMNYMLYNKKPGELGDEANRVRSVQRSLPQRAMLPELEHERYRSVEWEIVSDSTSDIGNGLARVEAVALVSDDYSKKVTVVEKRDLLHFLVRVRVMEDLPSLHVGWLLNDKHGLPALHLNNELAGKIIGPQIKGQELIFDFSFEFPPIADGEYVFTASAQEQGGEYTMYYRANFVHPIVVKKKGALAKQAGHTAIESASVDVSVF